MFRLLCYVNADILLLPDFANAVVRVADAKRRFLMVGQRCDLDVPDELSFDKSDWERDIQLRAAENGVLHPGDAMDYFVYPRGAMGPLPAFAVGRPSWDNWMIYRARKLRIPVVDATASALVIHQNHGYGHVKQAIGPRWEGPEADTNRALSGSEDFIFSLVDATHRLTPDSIDRTRGRSDLKRRIHRRMILGPASLRRASRPLRRTLKTWTRSRAPFDSDPSSPRRSASEAPDRKSDTSLD